MSVKHSSSLLKYTMYSFYKMDLKSLKNYYITSFQNILVSQTTIFNTLWAGLSKIGL